MYEVDQIHQSLTAHENDFLNLVNKTHLFSETSLKEATIG